MRITIRRVEDSKMYPFRDTGLQSPYTIMSIKKATTNELNALLNRMKSNQELTISIELKDISESETKE